MSNIKKDTLIKSILILLASVIAGAALFIYEYKNDPIRNGVLVRNEKGGIAYDETLTVDTGDGRENITVHVEPKTYTKAEIEELFSKTAKYIDETLLQDPITSDLSFPGNIDSEPVSLEWSVDRPGIIDYYGKVGDVSANGDKVVISVLMSLQDERREVFFERLVMPKTLSKKQYLEKMINDDIKKNLKPDEDIKLPNQIDGEEISFPHLPIRVPLLIVLCGSLLALMFPASEKQKEADAEKKRREEMLIDYPYIVERISLYVLAGMSLRNSIEKIAKDYYEKKKDGMASAGYEEILLTYYDMRRGIPESEAYRSLGVRAGISKFKTLSTLLVENQRKGGSEMISILQREVIDANEERLKTAKIKGEEAGTKLLFPMVLMLFIVIAVLIIPAFLTFA